MSVPKSCSGREARMQEVVKKLADEKGLDIVVDSANTVFFKPSFRNHR